MKYTFPMIIEQDGRDFYVHFPDVEGASTSGRTLKEAIAMGKDSLGSLLELLEREGKPIAEPTAYSELKLTDEQAVRMVEVDTAFYAELAAKIDGNPIRYAREQAGMSIKELADYLDAPYRTVQEWNAGRARPPKWIERILFNHIMDAR